MTSDCPKCGSDRTSILYPKAECDPAGATGQLNESCELLLVCAHCGYLGNLGVQEPPPASH
jgi:hypothetical protein